MALDLLAHRVAEDTLSVIVIEKALGVTEITLGVAEMALRWL